MKIIYAFWFSLISIILGIVGFTEFGQYAITLARYSSIFFAALAAWAIFTSIKRPSTGRPHDLVGNKRDGSEGK